MDYEKKYPITQIPGEYVLVQWIRGYKEVDVYYKDKLVGSVSGSAKLVKGFSFTSDLGLITLRLSKEPVTLDVIIDGYHSPVNVSHPVKELKSLSTYFYIIIAFAFIAGSMEVAISRGWNELLLITSSINFIVLMLYLTSVLYVRQGKPWAFYLGFGVFNFCALLSLMVLLSGFIWGWLFWFFMLMRIGGEVLLVINLKTAISATKHLKYKQPEFDELLDSKV
ncbi:MAG: hypothetical protein ACO1N0_10435 [Fluviicola sp.]